MSSYYTDLDDALGADEEAEQYLRQRALERRRDQLRILRITVNTVKNTPVRGEKGEVK